MSDEEVKDQQAEEQTEEKPDWDKEKQRTDQLEANVRKLSEVHQQAEEEKQTLLDKLANIEKAITQQQEKSTADLEPVDDALVDPKVARNLQKLADQHKELAAKYDEQDKKIKAYEAERERHLREEQTKRNVEKILKPLDEMYGEKYRTAARALADKMVNDGEVDVPPDALEAFLLLEKCYKVVKAKDDAAAAKKTTPTDSGFGGVAFDDSKATTGSREDVLADIRKKGLTGVGAREPVGY